MPLRIFCCWRYLCNSITRSEKWLCSSCLVSFKPILFSASCCKAFFFCFWLRVCLRRTPVSNASSSQVTVVFFKSLHFSLDASFFLINTWYRLSTSWLDALLNSFSCFFTSFSCCWAGVPFSVGFDLLELKSDAKNDCFSFFVFC